MSHVKRKRPRQPGRVARKKSNKQEWMSFLIILILVVSVFAAIVFAILSGPTG